MDCTPLYPHKKDRHLKNSSKRTCLSYDVIVFQFNFYLPFSFQSAEAVCSSTSLA